MSRHAQPAPPPAEPSLDPKPRPRVQPLSDAVLTWRLSAVAKALGISRRALERERSAGRFPPPDLTIGRMPLWKPETIRQWIERGGRP
jgi:predicted DNA-binding transcriptional regulator AlpA